MEIYTDGSHSLKPRMSGVGAVILNNGKEYKCSKEEIRKIKTNDFK